MLIFWYWTSLYDVKNGILIRVVSAISLVRRCRSPRNKPQVTITNLNVFDILTLRRFVITRRLKPNKKIIFTTIYLNFKLNSSLVRNKTRDLSSTYLCRSIGIYFRISFLDIASLERNGRKYNLERRWCRRLVSFCNRSFRYTTDTGPIGPS